MFVRWKMILAGCELGGKLLRSSHISTRNTKNVSEQVLYSKLPSRFLWALPLQFSFLRLVSVGREEMKVLLRAFWLPLATNIICFPFHYKETNLSLQFECGLPSLFICQLRAALRPQSRAKPINTKNIMRLCNQTLPKDVHLADSLKNKKTNKPTKK